MSIDGITRGVGPTPGRTGARRRRWPRRSWWSSWWRWARFVPAAHTLADRAHARTAADAAALAGAVEGEDTGPALADENRGGLLSFARPRVTRWWCGSGWAGRRRPPRPGRRVPAGTPGGVVAGTAGGRAGLAPAMPAALGRADGLLGRPVPVVSGLRTRAEQQALWDRRHANPYPVARPGTSDHERGRPSTWRGPRFRRSWPWPPRPGCASRCPTRPGPLRGVLRRRAQCRDLREPGVDRVTRSSGPRPGAVDRADAGRSSRSRHRWPGLAGQR